MASLLTRRRILDQTLFDPHFASVSLLLTGEGNDGSTFFLDRSRRRHVFTVNGTSRISTDQSIFPGASCFLGGFGNNIKIASSSAFGVSSTANFTVEGWFFAPSPSGGNKVAIDFRSSLTYVFGFGNGLTPYYFDSSDKYATASMTASTWNHVAWVRRGGNMHMYLNGTSVFTPTASSRFATAASLTVGTDDADSFSQPIYISNLRITNGVARYIDNFAVPDRPFPRG